jgi:hypothetical protein
VESAKNVYDKILELRIANAQIIINYASFLEENKYFEDSFRVGRKHSFFTVNRMMETIVFVGV